MRRVLFAFGLSFLAAQIGAASAPLAVLLPAAFLLAGSTVLLYRRHRRGYLMIACAGCCLALILFRGQYQLRVRPVLALAGKTHTLAAEVERVYPGYSAQQVRVVLRVTAADGRKAHFRVICPMLPESRAGERIEGSFRLEQLPPDGRRNGFYADGVYLTAHCDPDRFQKTGVQGGVRGALLSLRRRLADNVERFLPQPYGGIAAAMAVGWREDLTPEVQGVFRRAGLSHLLVVSGLHLTLLCGAFLHDRLFWGKLRRTRAVLSAVNVLLLMTITGFTPSVCRAGIAAIIYDVGLVFLLPADSLTSLGASALLLGVLNCYAGCDVGLQLSYCATMGVLFAGTLLREYKLEHPELPPLRGLLLKGAGLLAVPFFAAVFTLPVQLWQGMPVSGAALPANLLALPLVKPLLYGSILCALLGWLPGLALLQRAVSALVVFFARLLVCAAEFCGTLPFAELSLPGGYSLFVWGALFLLSCVYWQQGRFRWFWAAAPCFVLAAMLCTRALQQDVTRVELVGTRRNPCMTLCCQEKTMVLFRGGVYNQDAVQRWLAENHRPQLDLLIDLNEKPRPLELTAGRTVRAEELRDGSGSTERFAGAEIALLDQPEGNLALVQTSGFRLAMADGCVRLGGSCPVDLLAAGSDLPGGIVPRGILLTSTDYDWLSAASGAELFYSPGRPALEFRPGRPCRMMEVADVTHRKEIQ